MAACGPEIWDRAIRAGINLAMEASVCGGIPIHAVLREGISGDRVMALYGILNGTCNYILTEMEKRDVPLAQVLAEAQTLGYAEADPSADIDGFDARSKLVLLAALAFGEKITPSDIFMEGIRRISPIDFRYARQLKHTIRLICGARKTPERPDPFRASGADSRLDHSGRRAGRLQRGLGERQVWRGHVLLRLGRGRAAHRRGRRQRPDARGARDPQRQPRARLAVRPRTPGREHSRSPSPCRSAPTTCASAWKTAPASSPNWPAFSPSKKISLEAVLQEPCDTKRRPAVRDHRRTDHRSSRSATPWTRCRGSIS